MKAFFAKVWAWVLAHKIVAGVIAGAVTLAIVTAIVVPVSVSSARKKRAEQETQQNDGGGSQPATHEHTYADAWSSDATNHWHAATCNHDVKSSEEAHKFGAYSYDSVKGKDTRTCSVCGYVDEKNHEHAYSFKQFVWTENPGNYSAVAVYECSCGDQNEYNTVSVTDNGVTDHCIEDGVRTWSAQFKLDEETNPHDEIKEEPVAAIGHHHVGDGVASGVTDMTKYVCTECGEKIYEYQHSTVHFCFSYKLLSQPTDLVAGKIKVQAYDKDGYDFVPKATSEDGLKTCTLDIPAYIEDGWQYNINSGNKTLSLVGYGAFLSQPGNRDAAGIGINLNYLAKIFAYDNIFETYHFEDNFDDITAQMKYRFIIRRGWGLYPDISGDEDILDLKVARTEGFTFPNEATLNCGKENTHLVGFSTTYQGAKEHDIGELFDIPLDQTGTKVFYALWEND